MFPDGPVLAWDTDLIYQYFRLTGDGRLLVGGGTLRETYARARPDSGTPRRLARFVRKTFPALADVRFESYWPGLIGVTRDLLPLAGANPQRPDQTLAACAAGLPWSILAGQAAARAVAGAATDSRWPFRAGAPLRARRPWRDPPVATEFRAVSPLQQTCGAKTPYLTRWPHRRHRPRCQAEGAAPASSAHRRAATSPAWRSSRLAGVVCAGAGDRRLAARCLKLDTTARGLRAARGVVNRLAWRTWPRRLSRL